MAERSAPRVLRWALLQEGRVTDDRTARRPESLTLARLGLDNALGRELGLPRGFTLVEHRRGRWALRLLPGMRGQVTLAEGAPPVPLESLAGQARLELCEASKGRVSLGGVTVLFQFARPRPAPARPALPPAARGSWLGGLDRTFTAVVAGFLFVEFGGAYALSRRPVSEEEVQLDQLPDRWVRSILPARTPTPPKPRPEAARPGAAPRPAAPRREEVAQHDPDKLRQELGRRGTLGVLHSLGGELEQAVTGAVGAEAAGATIGKALEGASTALNAGDPNAPAGRKDTGPEASTIGALDPGQVRGPLQQGKRDAAVEGPPGGVVVDEPEVPIDQLDPAKIAAFVKRNLPAIQRCYEQELKHDRSLAGRVVVRFVITPAGGIASVDIDEDRMGSDAVDRCLQRTIRRWSLPLHPSAEAPVVYPFVFAPTG